MITCIYQIKNVKNGKVYVGSTVDFKKRRNSHLHYLRQGRHRNRHLQRAFDLYGEENFHFSIIKETTRDLLLSDEQDAINTLNPAYNICQVASSCLGVKRTKEHTDKIRQANTGKKHSDETKKKLSEANKGKHLSEETILKLKLNKKSIKVYQYDRKGNFLKSFPSIREAARQANLDSKTIRKCLKGEYKLAGGWIWKYDDEQISITELKDRDSHTNKQRPVRQYDLLGNSISDFISIAEAARQTGINARKICACCKKQINQVNGYKWEYIN